MGNARFTAGNERVAIEEVGIDAAGYLFLRPSLDPKENYEFIWRDASGVRWNEQLRALHAAEPSRWEHFELYKQILKAVRSEYGELLVLTPATRFTQVPTDLAQLIQGPED